MFVSPNQLHDATALVIEGNPQSRAILVSQLRELGLGTVAQCSRLSDARRKLEVAAFDVVICEQFFERESSSGQDLLDDLRRNQLLPFYTVFVMITAEASYSKVAEAAESALDAYLLKPHTGAKLYDRILQARLRKRALHDIFTAIDAQDFELASNLCMERFESRKPFWLYAARIGAELLLRNGRVADAQALYEAVIEAKTLPWARLGVARAQLEAGQTTRAVGTLESLIQDDAGYVDAYDVMGRAQFELGNFQNALSTFKMATTLTPASISRLLKHGMLAYFTGERSEGLELLDRATRIGLDSKMFDPQAVVLIAFARLDNNDQRGLARCVDQLTRLHERAWEPERPKRLLGIAQTLAALQASQTTQVLNDVRDMVRGIYDPGFDFEAACNLLGLLARLAARSTPIEDMTSPVDAMGMRFCTSRAMTELLACAANGNADFSERIRKGHTQILKITEQAMTLTLKGNPQGTVVQLLTESERTLNAKLVESAYQVLQRYAERIPNAVELRERIDGLRARFDTGAPHARLGENTTAGTAPGAVSLPTRYKPGKAEGEAADEDEYVR
ncbi:CheY-like chemotaxis protein [Hydrogenophaga palleronii]|uniref:CheY-like chemotaxis protein n=1 Tax=Hydrogenophaga palleronii TaxID=65655 RepID=A0ABU1WPE2_9BURK|nr:tetratricopeptide repeat protein [Hydrogenophaga palleronii]MDR7151165.1 CheY-like chemotaxis protein [Hydrogenophaga palleronii]